jgi:hypothetical protein
LEWVSAWATVLAMELVRASDSASARASVRESAKALVSARASE